MSDTSQKIDDKNGDEVLARMLKTPPKPNVKNSETESSDKDCGGDSRRPSN